MPHDPWLIAETREWLTKADEDLRAADLCLTTGRPVPIAAAFHAQQAAEKAMKGFLTWNQRAFRKTHDLLEIATPCSDLDPSLRDTLEPALSLTDYAWRHRYPGEMDAPTRAEAGQALMLAQSVFRAIVVRLPEEVWPH